MAAVVTVAVLKENEYSGNYNELKMKILANYKIILHVFHYIIQSFLN